MKHIVIKTWNPTDPIDFHYKPELLHNFHRQISFDVGYEDEESSTTFTVAVCSFTWLAHNYSQNGPLWGRHLLIVGQYDVVEIEAAISLRVQACVCDTWDKTVQLLCRYFAWEFEDYAP